MSEANRCPACGSCVPLAERAAPCDSERAEQFALIWEVPVDEVNALVAQVRREARESALEQAAQCVSKAPVKSIGEGAIRLRIVDAIRALASSEPAVQVEGAGKEHRK